METREQTRDITLNLESRLYVIPVAGGGFTCLGFDVACRWGELVAHWAGVPGPSLDLIGTVAGYAEYQDIMDAGRVYSEQTGERCPVLLTPELVGLEGKRVEVVDKWGEKRRFKVGKSTGWLPVHLELANRRSSGGPAVMGSPFKSVQVVG